MVFVFTEQHNGSFKKSAFEAMSYGAALAQQLGTEAHAIVLGECSETGLLGGYGARKVWHVQDSRLNTLNAKAYAKAIAQIMQDQQGQNLIFSNNNTAKAVAPRVSVRLKAGLVSGVIALPDTTQGFVVKKSVFSGKAFSFVRIETPIHIMSLTPNSFGLNKVDGTSDVQTYSVDFTDQDFGVKVESVQTVSGIVPLSEAELVVSGGRGLKGPENWGILEDLASSVGATLACSRPVADSHWRPHHEHVGQTGGTIRPNLYVAVGISGAIQHLAGVNSSKTIVVINKDPEAPFFKAADYGVLGDAFEVVPKLTEAIKKFKAAQNA